MSIVHHLFPHLTRSLWGVLVQGSVYETGLFLSRNLNPYNRVRESPVINYVSKIQTFPRGRRPNPTYPVVSIPNPFPSFLFKGVRARLRYIYVSTSHIFYFARLTTSSSLFPLKGKGSPSSTSPLGSDSFTTRSGTSFSSGSVPVGPTPPSRPTSKVCSVSDVSY